MGDMTAGVSDSELHHLYEFGRKLGIAFQLQEDILDSFGDAGKFGKKAGGDIVQNKKTFLILKALELADATDKANLLRLMSTPTSQRRPNPSLYSRRLIERAPEGRKTTSSR